MQRPTWRGGGGEGWEGWIDAHKEPKQLQEEREEIEREIAGLERERERKRRDRTPSVKEHDVAMESLTSRREHVKKLWRTKESWKDFVIASEDAKRSLGGGDQQDKRSTSSSRPRSREEVGEAKKEIRRLARQLEEKEKENRRQAQVSESTCVLPEVTALRVPVRF